MGQDYSDALANDYHGHRLAVIRRLLPDELFRPGKQIVDFGCGDAVLFPAFLDKGAAIRGLDVSDEMIKLAHARLSAAGHDPALAQLGGSDRLADVADGSVDAVMSFNVLAYLTDAEEAVFYREARRILRPGGSLIVTHSNELFDLFSLNAFTVDFFRRHFVGDEGLRARIPALLGAPESPAARVTYNVRENPLAYRHKLQRLGFREVQQEFINLHVAPPALLEGGKTYPQTLDWPEQERWRLMFTCSTFGSRALRE